MKISKRQLRKIIKEELQFVLTEKLQPGMIAATLRTKTPALSFQDRSSLASLISSILEKDQANQHAGDEYEKAENLTGMSFNQILDLVNDYKTGSKTGSYGKQALSPAAATRASLRQRI